MIHGCHDPLIPVACGEDTHRLLTNSSLRLFDGMGHDLPEPLLPEFAAMIDAHCQARAVPYQQLHPVLPQAARGSLLRRRA